ncbi:hypothetical protein C0Q70_07348 [Pomacea canaliculata]|uniref:Uncharacterized protein n=1 Tax=Pomacea canaliculata TaxID=400727 RepID=A0A2T7PET1_POMCA|nr:hypothetical protein C0Q70_07348 [Pomacea canaliculata]
MGQHLSRWSDDSYNNNNNSNNNNVAVVNGTSPERHGDSRRSPRGQQNKRKPHVVTDDDLVRATHDCLKLINTWFPERCSRTYFMPPVHMNTVKYKTWLGGEGTAHARGLDVQAVQGTMESDWRDDEVMQRTLHCLRRLGDFLKEPMVVILQMDQDNYLNKPRYSALTSKYPRPSELTEKLRRGDFDLLFVHLRYGLIVAEMKSVGWRPGQQQDDATVAKKLELAIKQLKKSKEVLQHLVSDLRPQPAIRRCLVLPNVSSQRLTQLLDTNPILSQELRTCFGASSVTDAVSLCLCSDLMTSREQPADVTDAILQRMQKWWNRLVTSQGIGGEGTPEIYDYLLASSNPCVYLTGPPGTGKTLILVLRTVLWARQGHVVHVASTGSFSEAATQLIFHQATKTLEDIDKEAVANVQLLLNGNKREIESVVTSLTESCQNGQLYVIADEADGMFTEFFTKLKNNVSDLHVWAASYHHQHRPPNMDEERLTVSLRCPPAVMRRVETAVSFTNNAIYRFNTTLDPENIRPPVTDGPPELLLSHLDHSEQFAMNCEQCGLDIGHCLLEKLAVGQKQRVATIKAPPALQYRDIMVIPDWYQNVEDLHDEERLPSGEVTKEASGIVRGLRKMGLPVMVVTSGDQEAIQDVVRSLSDVVAVVGWGVVNGLERKVVVSVGEGREMSDGSVSGVLHGASRCTAQLIYVKCPE